MYMYTLSYWTNDRTWRIL